MGRASLSEAGLAQVTSRGIDADQGQHRKLGSTMTWELLGARLKIVLALEAQAMDIDSSVGAGAAAVVNAPNEQDPKGDEGKTKKKKGKGKSKVKEEGAEVAADNDPSRWQGPQTSEKIIEYREVVSVFLLQLLDIGERL
jgi:hypothetical protein